MKEKDAEANVAYRKQSKFSGGLFAETKGYFKYIDIFSLILVLILVAVGLIMVFSSSMYIVNGESGMSSDPMGELIKQGLAVFLGSGLALIAFILPKAVYREINLVLLANGFLLVLLILTLLIGITSGGSTSWLPIFSFSLQPSEFFKIVFVISFAWILTYQHREVNLSKDQDTNRKLTVLVCMLIAAIAIIAAQPDWGMVIIILAVAIVMFLIDRATWRQMALILSAVFIAMALVRSVAHLIPESLHGMHYILDRIAAFGNPFYSPDEYGYQIINGFVAFSRGGWLGVGLGQGMMKRDNNLPAINTDYIIANIAEELGFVGVFLVLGVLFLLICRIYYLSSQVRYRQDRLVLVGLASMLLVQSFVNVGGALGLIPLTGVTLPFISMGGSSMVTSLLMMGLIQAIWAQDQYAKAVKPDLKLVYPSKNGGMTHGNG